MDKTDISSIKLGGEAFTSKWWKKKRAIAANGSGVGKALDAWVKNCPANPDMLKDEKAVDAARKTAEALKSALAKAKSKCGKLSKETADACDKYVKEVNKYVGELSSGNEDADKWKQILVAMPKAINQMLAMTKQMDKAIADLKKYNETAKLIASKADLRNKMPVHGARTDLDGALNALEMSFGKIDKFLNKDAGFATRIGDPVLDIEATMKTRDHDKDMRVFRKMVVDIGKKEGELRDAVTDTNIHIRTARDLVNKSDKTVARAKDQLEMFDTAFWDNPAGGAKEMKTTLSDLTLKAQTLAGKDFSSLDERGKRDMSTAIKELDSEMLQLDSNITNLGNTFKQAQAMTREFAKDPLIAASLKKMGDALKLILMMKKKFDQEVKNANRAMA